MARRIFLKPHRIELLEKHSRFIGIGFPCHSIEEFKARKLELEVEFPDASHIVFAYRFMESGQLQQRFSDAGEPSGTAGKPVMMHIDGQDFINLAVFIIRYFGGTKLGAGGLVRAYGNTAKQLLLESSNALYILMVELDLRLPYHEQQRLDYLSRKHGATILRREYAEDLQCRISLPEAEKAEFLANLSPYLLP